MLTSLDIWDSARKHGITDDDILHAVRQVLRIIEGSTEIAIYIGADSSGRLLEIGIVNSDTDNPRIVHAMALRSAWYAYLR